MSPGSQKFTTPPKKGEGNLPPPMSMEESIEAFEHLGIYPQIEQWRDCLRQWFSSVLLNPLLNKIETCHIQVLHHFHLLIFAIILVTLSFQNVQGIHHIISSWPCYVVSILAL